MISTWLKENKAGLCTLALMVGLTTLFTLVPDLSFAQYGSDFESKVGNINSNLITRILPLISVFGLIYASVLAINGDGEAKGKIFGVLFASVVGFLAPQIIEWLKALAL
jgi:hypothetical protein